MCRKILVIFFATWFFSSSLVQAQSTSVDSEDSEQTDSMPRENPASIKGGRLVQLLPPKYEIDSEHPPGHADWDWYCDDNTHSFYPAVIMCGQHWVARSDGPTSERIAEEKAQQARNAAEGRRQKELNAQYKRQNDAVEAQQRKQEAEQRQKEMALRSEDAAKGYTPTTVIDFLLDYKKFPANTKLVLTGSYERLGSSELLTASPTAANPPILLNTDALPREYQTSLLECAASPYHNCRATFRVHTGCSVTQFGFETPDPCLIVDEIRPPPHFEQGQ